MILAVSHAEINEADPKKVCVYAECIWNNSRVFLFKLKALVSMNISTPNWTQIFCSECFYQMQISPERTNIRIASYLFYFCKGSDTILFAKEWKMNWYRISTNVSKDLILISLARWFSQLKICTAAYKTSRLVIMCLKIFLFQIDKDIFCIV